MNLNAWWDVVFATAGGIVAALLTSRITVPSHEILYQTMTRWLWRFCHLPLSQQAFWHRDKRAATGLPEAAVQTIVRSLVHVMQVQLLTSVLSILLFAVESGSPREAAGCTGAVAVLIALSAVRSLWLLGNFLNLGYPTKTP